MLLKYIWDLELLVFLFIKMFSPEMIDIFEVCQFSVFIGGRSEKREK